MNYGLVDTIPAHLGSTTDRKGQATMADKTSAQPTIDAVLARFAVAPAAPGRNTQRANVFPGTPRIDRKSARGRAARTRDVAFRAAAQRPLRIPGRG